MSLCRRNQVQSGLGGTPAGEQSEGRDREERTREHYGVGVWDLKSRGRMEDGRPSGGLGTTDGSAGWHKGEVKPRAGELVFASIRKNERQESRESPYSKAGGQVEERTNKGVDREVDKK